MRGFSAIGAVSLIGLLLAGPAPAQQSSPDHPPTRAEQHAAPNPTATPSAPATPGATATAEQPAPRATNPGLAIASVTARDGQRASRLIGSRVYTDQNRQIGILDDLIVTPDAKVAIAVISVGGFLGIGSKLVAVPFDQLRLETGKDAGLRVMLPGASRETLNAMPNFTFGNS